MRCSFRGTRLTDFRVNPATPIDCDFTGANACRSIFWGGPTDYDLRQCPHMERCNEIHGNDFSGAALVGISFRRGADPTLQHPPPAMRNELFSPGAAAQRSG